MADGIFLSPLTSSSQAKIAVLGQTVLRELFSAAENPISQTVRLNGTPFQVVGVLAAKGMGVSGEDQDDLVVIPWTTAQRRMLGITHIKDMYISAVSPKALPEAKHQITALLRQRHHLTSEQPDDHTIRDYTEIAEQMNETNRVMTLLLSSVASLALLIGGINTMTIMLVTVTERTREIGIRMAVGARAGLVRLEFLVEAVLLTLVGGLAGVAIGIATAVVVADRLHWPTVVSSATIALGLLVSSAVGLMSGVYPALKASSLDPIEALRFE